MLSSRVALPADLPEALRVWQSANIARGLAPASVRISRVQEKLTDPAALLVIVCDGEILVGMALAEPFREDQGAGQVAAGAGHVSMVFVDPNRWGVGIGGHLVNALHDVMRAATWSTASLWTRAGNERARRLYERHGYQLTGDTNLLAAGDQILRYEAHLQ